MSEDEAGSLITDRRGEVWATCDGCGEVYPPAQLVDYEEHGQLCQACKPEPIRVECCTCGAMTTFDSVYEDLCYRCIRAENE